MISGSYIESYRGTFIGHILTDLAMTVRDVLGFFLVYGYKDEQACSGIWWQDR